MGIASAAQPKERIMAIREDRSDHRTPGLHMLYENELKTSARLSDSENEDKFVRNSRLSIIYKKYSWGRVSDSKKDDNTDFISKDNALLIMQI